MDLPDAQERWKEVEPQLRSRGIEPIAISAATQSHVKDLIQRVFALIDSLPEEATVQEVVETPLYELQDSGIGFEITRDAEGAFHVTGKRIERAAAMTYWDYEEAVLRFQQILETLGVSEALVKAGVKVGDTVYIGDFELEWAD
jgi:GTP-binding protein